jgi:hypothetical protein
LDDDVRPTILVGKAFVSFAINPARARMALAAETRQGEAWAPRDEVVRTFGCLPSELTSLSVADPSNSAWPHALSRLPGYTQLGMNMLGFVGDDTPSPVSGLQAALGIPGPRGFRIRIPPALIPKAKALQDHLFPSVLATVVDARGIRWIGREAFPFACVGGGTLAKPSVNFNLTKPENSTFKIDFDLLRALGR